MTANDTTTAATRTETTTTTPMGEVDHTHPKTNQTFGFVVYGRGVVADGGREQEADVMEDVDHESDTDGASRTFDRGNEKDRDDEDE